MGHHINEKGEFQSDKHPELPPDRIRINFKNPRSWKALRQLADDYSDVDSELAEDIYARVAALELESKKAVVIHASGRGEKLAIVGSRDYARLDLVTHYVTHSLRPTITVISGGARGVDRVAVETAKAVGLPFKEYPADWDRYGKAAGPIRNSTLVEVANAVVAFWDEQSSGTLDTIEKAYQAGKLQWVVGAAGQLVALGGLQWQACRVRYI